MSDSAASVFGESFFSFAHVSRADEGITSTDGFARMESGELRASLDKKQVNFIDLPSTAASPELPLSDDFICPFEATWDCFGGEMARTRRADPHSSSSAKQHRHKFTKGANTCKGILPPRMVKTTT
ncbi:hypothetical protein TRVL_03871 [Trypanosoma vivax]|nr:hypothetical protein TRVL_03871 [Trypanosoma vivax]